MRGNLYNNILFYILSRLFNIVNKLKILLILVLLCQISTVNLKKARAYQYFFSSPRLLFEIGRSGDRLLLNDFNNDNSLDILCNIQYGSTSLYNFLIAFNNGDGYFFDKKYYSYSLGELELLNSGDFDNDNNFELILTDNNNSKFYILKIDENNDTLKVFTELDIDAIIAKVADLNNDSYLDIVVESNSPYPLIVLINDKHGNFYVQNYNLINFKFIIDDFNDDNFPDLVINYSKTTYFAPLAILYNQGNGRFSQVPYIIGDFYAIDLKSADFNLDGYNDIALIHNKLYILNNNGNGDFTNYVINLDLTPSRLQVGDLNNDNFPDLVIFCYYYKVGGQFVILLNQNGEFTQANEIIYNNNAVTDIKLNDINNDNLLDIVYIFDQENYINVLFNQGNGSFGNFNTYSTGKEPSGIINGDFNNDNYIDLAVVNKIYSKLSILLNDKEGNFQPYFNISLPQGAFEIKTGDLDMDSDLDIITSNFYEDKITVLINDGKANFNISQTFYVSNGPKGLAVADFNNDYYLDFAYCAERDSKLGISFNNGNGYFIEPVEYDVNDNPSYLTADDFNNDNFIDIACINETNIIKIFFNDGKGGFQRSKDVPSKYSPIYIKSADLNNDNFIDIVYCDYHNIFIMLNRGDESFNEPVQLSSGNYANYFDISDLNNDNYPDLLITNDTTDNVCILMNNQSDSFNKFDYYLGLVDEPGYITSGDFNNDSFNDFAVTGLTHNQIYIFFNSGNYIPPEESSISLKLYMPKTTFYPGDEFWLNDIISVNSYSNHISGYLFLILDSGTNEYWFWPDWVHYPPDYNNLPFYFDSNGKLIFNVIKPFNLPDNIGTFQNLTFLSFITDTNLTKLISNIDATTFQIISY